MKTKKNERKELFPLLIQYTDWIMDWKWWIILLIALLVVAGILVGIVPAIWPIVLAVWIVAMSILWGIPTVLTAIPNENGYYPEYTRHITWKNLFGVLTVLAFCMTFYQAATGALVTATIFAFLMLGNILFLWFETEREKRYKNQ